MSELFRQAMERRWQEKQRLKRLERGKRKAAQSKQSKLSAQKERPTAQPKRVSPTTTNPTFRKYTQVQMKDVLDQASNEEQEEYKRLSKVFS